jgi:hypothetical protein
VFRNLESQEFGATARFQRDYNGKRPGDPKKAAQAIARLTQDEKPPLRLLLGSDACNGEKNDLALLEEARSWKELSLFTDFESKPPPPGATKVNLPSRNPAHGRATFSRRANRRNTLRIFCFVSLCQDRLELGDRYGLRDPIPLSYFAFSHTIVHRSTSLVILFGRLFAGKNQTIAFKSIRATSFRAHEVRLQR